MTQEIQEKAKQIMFSVTDKILEPIEDDLKLQLELTTIVENNIVDIEATRDMLKSATTYNPNTLKVPAMQVRESKEGMGEDNESFKSDYSFKGKRLADSMSCIEEGPMYYSIITGYDHIFNNKVKTWKKDIMKQITYHEQKIDYYWHRDMFKRKNPKIRKGSDLA